MIKRDIETELKTLAGQYPVVTVSGPRQAGKTTLCRIVFPEYNYCNLELPEQRQLAADDPRAFLAAFPPPVIIDEIQRVPELLSYIQVITDELDQPGRFILTGSHQLGLHEAVSQSLAGRTALLTLLPLSIRELSGEGITLSRDQYLLKGFLPRIYKDNLDSTKAYRNYFQTYIERDLHQVSNIRNLDQYEKFMRLLAGRVGQVINLNSMSNDIGVSSTTLAEWLTVLEASYVIFRLKPYYENFGKRLVKSSKLYFTDVGLAVYLLGISELNQVSRDPLLGNLFENLVVIEALKTRMNHGLDANLYFYRDSNQQEVDLIYRKGNSLVPIEIKAAMTYNKTLIKNIRFFQGLTGSSEGYLVYAGDFEPALDDLDVVNFIQTHRIF